MSLPHFLTSCLTWSFLFPQSPIVLDPMRTSTIILPGILSAQPLICNRLRLPGRQIQLYLPRHSCRYSL